MIGARPSDPAVHVTSPVVTRGPRPDARCSVRVLVVDEHVEWSHFVAHGLRRHGHAIVLADSIDRALLLAEVQRFDLLVTSLSLPDGSGHTLLRLLRERNPRIHAVAVSESDADQGVVSDTGFDYYMKKPVPIAALSRAVTLIFS